MQAMHGKIKAIGVNAQRYHKARWDVELFTVERMDHAKHIMAGDLMSRLKFYAGLFLMTSSTLMLQVIQTRILSVVAWYYLAFFAISMAMFGLTAGAVWVYMRRDRFTGATLSDDLAHFSAGFAITTVLCLASQMTLAPTSANSLTAIWTWVELALCMSMPFVLSGIVVSLALTRSPFPIGRVYGADMLGAAVGCLGVLLLLNHTDGPSAVLWVGAIAAAGSLCFAGSAIGATPTPALSFHGILRWRKTIFLCLVALALINGSIDVGLQPIISKGNLEQPTSYMLRAWNSFSRVAVARERTVYPFMWGRSPIMPVDLRIQQRFLNIDGLAGSPAYRFSGNLAEVAFVKYDVTNFAYMLPGCQRAAVIGVGGGRDLLSAAVFGCQEITGIEINPIFIRLLTEEPGFVDFTNLTKLDHINFVVDEGRSWFAGTSETFDVIQMSLIDTWAATGAGAFTLSENGLYTVEAWKTFVRRLTPKGVFTVSRWYSLDNVDETGRMISLASAALMDLGIRRPRRHIVLVAQGRIATLLLSRTPFSKADLDILEREVNRYRHQIILHPTREPASKTLAAILAAPTLQALTAYISGLDLDLTPPTDNRPFFFNQLPLNQPIKTLALTQRLLLSGAGAPGVATGNLVATGTLLLLFLVSLAFVLATIIIPLRPALKDAGGKVVTGGTLYFLLIGAGFMLIEIGLLQRMSIFLGHPIYALSVLLFTLILATGVGSLSSDRVLLNSWWKFALWALLTGGYAIVLPYWLPDVLLRFNSANLLTRATVCVATIAPAGFLMGFGFPTGMRLVSAIDTKPTPWFWGINGAAGVLASVAAIAISIAFGISTTLIMGAVCYVLLIPTVLMFMPPHNTGESISY